MSTELQTASASLITGHNSEEAGRLLEVHSPSANFDIHKIIDILYVKFQMVLVKR